MIATTASPSTFARVGASMHFYWRRFEEEWRTVRLIAIEMNPAHPCSLVTL